MLEKIKSRVPPLSLEGLEGGVRKNQFRVTSVSIELRTAHCLAPGNEATVRLLHVKLGAPVTNHSCMIYK